MSKPIFSKQHHYNIPPKFKFQKAFANEKFITYLNFADAFKKGNPNFNIDKFLSAIYSIAENSPKKGGD